MVLGVPSHWLAICSMRLNHENVLEAMKQPNSHFPCSQDVTGEWGETQQDGVLVAYLLGALRPLMCRFCRPSVLPFATLSTSDF